MYVYMGEDVRIPMNTTGTTDIHNHPILTISHAEIWRRSTNKFKRGRGVDGQHRMPLFIRHLHNHLISISQHFPHKKNQFQKQSKDRRMEIPYE